jgi:hypothetical protein
MELEDLSHLEDDEFHSIDDEHFSSNSSDSDNGEYPEETAEEEEVVSDFEDETIQFPPVENDQAQDTIKLHTFALIPIDSTPISDTPT